MTSTSNRTSRTSRKSYTVAYKLQVIAEVNARPAAVTIEDIASKHGLALQLVKSWLRQYRLGNLCMDRAVSVSRRPEATCDGSAYVINGQRFKTIDECVRYAVEELGGIVKEVTTTKRITL